MANQRRDRKLPEPRRSRDALRENVFALTSEMEEPLRHALQMVRVLGLINPHEEEDREAIGYVAHEAAHKLAAVSDGLRALFAACEPS
jgi:hypothetical protein